ncbi:hypothetical protein KSP39_PZI005212 [Platanthera zijinensis]|uniref:Signal peptidase complex catalytic subunit SEC11 n=1 Tax=Platanthera zijinensis TaxID=2320716 RepID=A0AAP0BTX2_9ASPA
MEKARLPEPITKRRRLGWIRENVDSIRSIQKRQVLTQAVSLGMIVTSALIIWKGLMCVTGSESPVVVVLSGRMNYSGFPVVGLRSAWFKNDTLLLEAIEEVAAFEGDDAEGVVEHRDKCENDG